MHSVLRTSLAIALSNEHDSHERPSYNVEKLKRVVFSKAHHEQRPRLVFMVNMTTVNLDEHIGWPGVLATVAAKDTGVELLPKVHK